jgi:hypothetical protein
MLSGQQCLLVLTSHFRTNLVEVSGWLRHPNFQCSLSHLSAALIQNPKKRGIAVSRLG